jgi:hypothetical protein
MMGNIDRTTLISVAHQLVSEFLDAINRTDIDLLRSEFDIDNKVYQEIQESLKVYFDNDKLNLAPPPLDNIFEGKWIFDLYGEEDEDKCWGIDCQLFNNAKISEAMAHFDLFKHGNEFLIKYLYIAS